MTKWHNRQSERLSSLRSCVQSPLQTRDTLCEELVNALPTVVGLRRFGNLHRVYACNCKLSVINGRRVLTKAVNDDAELKINE